MEKVNKTKKQKDFSTLLSCLSNGATGDARKLLKKYSGEEAVSTKDLELKLAKVYASSTSKYDLEKEFADIHPHKEFILRYNKPIQVVEENPIVEKPVEVKQDTEKPIIEDDFYSSNGHQPCGNPNCPSCGRYFSFGGNSANGTDSQGALNQYLQTPLILIGVISIVALFGMVLINQKNR